MLLDPSMDRGRQAPASHLFLRSTCRYRPNMQRRSNNKPCWSWTADAVADDRFLAGMPRPDFDRDEYAAEHDDTPTSTPRCASLDQVSTQSDRDNEREVQQGDDGAAVLRSGVPAECAADCGRRRRTTVGSDTNVGN